MYQLPMMSGVNICVWIGVLLIISLVGIILYQVLLSAGKFVPKNASQSRIEMLDRRCSAYAIVISGLLMFVMAMAMAPAMAIQ